MIKNKFLNNKNENILITTFLGLFVLLTQFYSIDNEVINWDESDFILMGSSFYKGNLPYLELWDLKPPIHFMYIGTYFKLFGPSLLTARLSGDILVFATSLLLYKISLKKFNKFESITIAIIYISLVSFEFAQPTMTEYLSTFFLLISMIFFEEKNHRNLLYTGFFISLAVFTRTNTAFVWLFYLVYILINKFKTKNIIWFLAGSSVPFLVLTFLYILEGKFKEFFYSVFLIPLQNTLVRDNFFDILEQSYEGIFLENLISIPLFFLLFIIFFLISIFLKREFRKKIADNFYLIKLYFFVFVFVCLSILVGGRFYYHYLIQLFPFFSIFIVFSISKLFNFKKTIFVVIYFFLFINSFPLVNKSVSNLQNFDSLKENYVILKTSKLIDPSKTVLALDSHLIYFYLDTKPLTPVVHPNVIFKTTDYKLILSSLEEIGYLEKNSSQKLLESFPYYIVCKDLCFDYVDKAFFDSYRMISNLENVKLYEYKK